MRLDDITPLILTFNEEDNLQRTLSALRWAKQIVVIDSGSTDRTLEIARRYSAVRVFYREFDHFAEQCNFGLSKIVTTWVLSIDADYVCPKELPAELNSLDSTLCSGYRAGFIYAVFGIELRATLYPARVILYQSRSGKYARDGHAHRVEVDGVIGELRSRIRHDDRKSTARWLRSQCKYADLEVAKFEDLTPKELGWKDRIRTWIVFAPPLTLVYCLFARGLVLDGWGGVYYTLQRVIWEMTLSLKLLDCRLRRRASQTESPGATRGGIEA